MTATTSTSSLPADAVPTGPVNLRDLGGIEAVGGVVRTGFAVRADDLSTIGEEAAEALAGRGLRAVIDLRSAVEVELTGRGPLQAMPRVSYHHVPLAVDLSGVTDGVDVLDQRSYGDMYLRIVDRAAAEIVTALAIIAYAPGLVAFHCAAGQDRTGVLAASLLLALGADAESIVADYVRTGENREAIHARLRPTMAVMIAQFGLELDDILRAAVREEFSPLPMRRLLEVLRERHGDPLAPLRAAGLTNDLIGRLRERGIARGGGGR